ncbi:MAG: UbiX family flavin prenyltransferase [Bryobacterales bacterium]
MVRRIVVGISGASGALYGVRLLERLAGREDVETHLVVSRAGEKTLHHETGLLLRDVRGTADHAYSIEEVGAAIASGSFLTDGMVIAPCSVNTLSAIAYGMASNLLVRAADVTLKERRRLVLMVRESPLHLGHLRAMAAATEMGAIIAPPMPDFYNRPATVEDVVEQGVGRILDLLGLSDEATKRWAG